MNTPKTARDWLDLVLDAGYELLFEDVIGGDPLKFPGYAEQLERARATTGCSESVLVADGAIDGRRVVAFSFEFGFLGGSMGVASGERICRAFELGAREGVPVIGLTASGGARMQEGMLALAQMPATLVARGKLAQAHQPFVCYLRNPTTGGVYASFASSADVIWAEPGATIGFAGPRVAETFTGQPLPEGSHTSEWAHRHELVGAVFAPTQLHAYITNLFRVWTEVPQRRTVQPLEAHGGRDAWATVQTARDDERPQPGEYTGGSMFDAGGSELNAGLMRLGGTLTMCIQLPVTNKSRYKSITTERYRRVRRVIQSAVRLNTPVVTFIDTKGADPSSASEADGIAREISETFEVLLAAPVPTVALVTGEGGSGGALALAVCDRLLIQENAFFSVIAPEGAAAILRRDDVESVARDLKLTAHDLRAFGLADLVVPEPNGGAKADVAAARAAIEEAVAWALADIEAEGGAPTARRTGRWRVWKP